MSSWFRLVSSVKKILRPVLLPLLQRSGLKRWQTVYIPKISARDRLHADQVPTKVTIRNDQTILINNEPFFPLGLYYVKDDLADMSGDRLRKLKAMGFNLIFFNGGLESEELLDRIRDAGLYVWYRPPGELYHKFDVLKQVVAKFAKHPAVLFWEMDDEPVLNGLKLSDVKIGCDIVRKIDAFHPILCNQWLSNLDQTEDMRKWGRLADVYGFSIYPVPLWRWGNRMSLVENGWPHSIAVVGKQTRFWKSIAPDKPIIPVLQSWAADCIEDGEDAYPTYQECRFIAYQAVINGAKGLHHYGAIDPAHPIFACGIPPRIHTDLNQTHADFILARQYNQWFWSYYSNVIKELSIMSRIFTSQDGDWSPLILESSTHQTANQIECRVKQCRDSVVIILINSSNIPSRIELHAPKLVDQKLNVWGLSRTIQVNPNGILRDELEPFGVRVYSDQVDLLSDLSNSILSGDEHGSSSFAAKEKSRR
ncbi:MAG TPA: hypothetical protein VEF04_00040 [Blastocatellia bacterium]|nr:hypothetical protein [Blastocatellia bacterium]